ncbi:MAG: hypothetical protein JO198_07895 [Candidatus Dormibacteraeota bacterium]|nr:hypothetical protein [Candidatus Dormibacteraeota bacterium]
MSTRERTESSGTGDGGDFEVVTGGEVLRRYRTGDLVDAPVEFDDGDVPSSVRHLIPLARHWGIGDDVLREHLVHAGDPRDLAEMKAAVEAAEDALDAWLTSADALRDPSAAYLAFTSLRMAAELVP